MSKPPRTEIDFLRHYGLDRETTAILRAEYGDELLPVQETAILRHRLFDGGNMVISSPTSSGKTLVGEIACLRYASADRSSIFLVPTKALANEKYRHFRRAYGRKGFHVIVSTRDQRRDDGDLIKGEYHIAVVVYEKLKALITAQPSLLREVGLLVVDELQTVFDSQRGPQLEILLTQIRRAHPEMQILGLSAVLGPGKIDEWLDAVIVEDNHRPAPLRQGVICDGVFHYREYTTGEAGEEVLAEPEALAGCDEEEDLIIAHAIRFARSGEQTLVFLPRRDLTVKWALRLAAQSELPPAEGALKEIDDLEETLARENLRQTLQNGVAFHNSDLTWSERELVERYTAKGEIRLLTSTNTLAEGVNLPIVNTLASRYSYRSGSIGLQPGAPPQLGRISKAEFQNMTGRSGRYGHATLGRGALVTAWPADVKAMLARYVDGPFDDQEPVLFNQDLALPILHLIASRSAHNAHELTKLLESTLSGWTAPERVRGLDEEIERRLCELADLGLMRKVPRGWDVTDAGRIAAQYALSPDTVHASLDFLRTLDGPPAFHSVLYFLARQAEGRAQYVPFSQREWQADLYWTEWLRRQDAPEIENPERPTYEDAAAIKKALLLMDWMSEEETAAIERRYGVLAGGLKKLGEAFGWLAQALADLAAVAGCPETMGEELDLLGRRLAAGCPAEYVSLAEVHAPGLSRSALRALYRAGCQTREELFLWTSAQMAEVLPENAARRLHDWLHGLDNGLADIEPVELKQLSMRANELPEVEIKHTSATQSPHRDTSATFSLEVNEDRPDIIRVNGAVIEVTRLEYALVRALVKHRGVVLSYDRLMELMWEDAVVQRQQILSHKRTLAIKIEKACGKRAAEALKTVRGIGLMLAE